MSVPERLCRSCMLLRQRAETVSLARKMILSATTLTQTYLAGKMIADQAKEFGKGLKEGSGHENQFEKYDEPPKPSAWKRLKEKVLGSNKSE